MGIGLGIVLLVLGLILVLNVVQFDIGFIDEFHCDKDGFRVVAKAVGDKVETVLDAKPPGGQVKEPAAATAAG